MVVVVVVVVLMMDGACWVGSVKIIFKFASISSCSAVMILNAFLPGGGDKTESERE